MNDLSVFETRGATQAPTIHRHPTPLQIRCAVTAALSADLRNPDTPYVPVHVDKLIDDAITRACDEAAAGSLKVSGGAS